MKKSKVEIKPHADNGFFAPGSVTRKVWGYPTTPLMGIIRAVVIEEFDPNLVASVHQTGANYDRLDTRYARTVQYFAAVAFADSATVAKMADVLVKIHSKSIGIEPVSGNKYDANDPDSQLWILITGWHSVLTAYEMFGPGKLTEAEENEFWADCAIAAEFQTCDPLKVPRNAEEVRAYFDSWEPRLASSLSTHQMINQLLNGVTAVLAPHKALHIRLLSPIINFVMRKATIATLPRHMRELANVRQGRFTDLWITVLARLLMAAASRSLFIQRWVLGMVAPRTLAIIEPHWQGLEPLSPEILTPAQARERYGYPKPADAHLELRARQHHRVFDEHLPPSDEGLIESQPVLGTLG
ncbi:oxygenase MpaB family protein [Nocardioides cavernaquae]|uniref:DUF2236 domain-containing protein n=1 Tax=Nocardioides cavernaquae TaxID=2321396 RepID=A0A3A5HEH5_9ACTN|nr:oxygenase MpaB family protein [Nocardioides cavernaquae]RJS46390.1 DUF2236 domain-containing protein [Nocardioides cavernaquae]